MAPFVTHDFSLDVRLGQDAVTSRGSVTHNAAGEPPRLLALHGGGQSSRRGIRYLLAGLAQGGVSSAACALIERLNPPALVLFCPAAYVAAAVDAPFGPRFQAILRATVDYAGSPAFEALEGFEGRLLLVFGTQDAIIPAQVLDQYARRARRAKSVEVVRLLGAGHRLHAWLPAHEDDHRRVLGAVRRTLTDA